MSIFTKTDEYTQKPPRNTFDGSFANNLTLKAGQITPCFLKEVIPGDSFKIDAKLGFNFMPMTFPVQTDMQCNLHFFYVRNRALWKGWENFITKTENLEGDSTPPYIVLTEQNRQMFETGEIGDYLGVPTVFYGTDNEYSITELKSYKGDSATQKPFYATGILSDPIMSELINVIGNSTGRELVLNNLSAFTNNIFSGFYGNWQHNSALSPSETMSYTQFFYSEYDLATYKFALPTSSALANAYGANYSIANGDKLVRYLFDENYRVVAFLITQYQDGNWNIINQYNYIGEPTVYFDIRESEGDKIYTNKYRLIAFLNKQARNTINAGLPYVYTATNRLDARFGIANKDRKLSNLPFVNSEGDGELRISAMPFRAVEACYNSFYRDDRNNPLMINGKPYYNTWVHNRNGGADTGLYKLYRKNWQPDVFTTAVQSPQQGIMPLVGVTATGQMTFSDEAGKTYYLQAEFGDDGQTITGISSYSSDMPAGTLRSMVDTISTGISINDFRNVNALQRWLETNMRKGLRYKDQIEAHFGTSPTYSELQMPEFIGGMSRRVSMSAIEQTVDTLNPANGTGNALGTLGGRASVVGNDGSPVTHYCDEHGWIIGFVTITPSPVYSQQLNKQLLKHNLLDYYFPEFAHIGYQPILNEEIAPLQCKSGQQPNGNGLKDVFGYNRAWYEYLENVDEVHGDFRTSLRNFLIQRIFNGVPKLGEEFLTVSDREVNQVFAVNDDSDKIFGQIYFDVKMKRPFPRLGIPKLETE